MYMVIVYQSSTIYCVGKKDGNEEAGQNDPAVDG
jgi:hypothetical protein